MFPIGFITVPFTVTASSPKLFSVPFLSIISVYSLSFSFAVTYIFTIVCSFSVDIVFVATFVSIPKLFICTSAVLYKLVAHISDVSWSASIIALYVSLLIFVASTPSTFTLSNSVNASSLYIVNVYSTMFPLSAVTSIGITFLFLVCISTVFVVCFISFTPLSMLTCAFECCVIAVISGFTVEFGIIISYSFAPIDVASTPFIVRFFNPAFSETTSIVSMKSTILPFVAFTLIFTILGFVSSFTSCINVPVTYVAPWSILMLSVASFVVIFIVPVPSLFATTDTPYLFSPTRFAVLPFTYIVSILCSSNGCTTLKAVAFAPVVLSVAVIVASPMS